MKGLTTFQGQSEGRLLSLECALLENLFITKLNNFWAVVATQLANQLLPISEVYSSKHVIVIILYSTIINFELLK